jgi:biotin carboxyl carrier protein
MNSVEINGQSFDVAFENALNKGKLNNIEFEWDLKPIGNSEFHLIYKNKSFVITLLSYDSSQKEVKFVLNGKKIIANVKNETDKLLKAMGFDLSATSKVNEIKAPMPGMVLRILVVEGTEVKKGDGLLVLEAMKMENIIKSPTDATVKKITVTAGKAVEKNQVLVTFA